MLEGMGMGLGKRREAILVMTVETPIYRRILKQYYYRDSNSVLILRERMEIDSTHPNWHGVQGCFFDFFGEAAKA